MYHIGKVKEFHSAQGFGFLLGRESDQEVFFQQNDFPTEGGPPQKGENVKYLIVQEQGKFKASQIVRLDVAMNKKLKKRFAEKSAMKRFDPVQKNRNTARSISAVLSMLVLGLAVVGYYGWNKFQQYKEDQANKLQMYTQQEQQVILEQRKAVGALPGSSMSRKNQDNLRERMGETASISASRKVETTRSRASTQGYSNQGAQNTAKNTTEAMDVKVGQAIRRHDDALQSQEQ